MKNNMIFLIKKTSAHEHPSLVTFLNPYSYLLARKHIDLFNRFDQIYIDGIALVRVLGLFNIVTVQRKSFDMTSMVPEVLEEAIQTSKTLYFIGAKPHQIDHAITNIKKRYPKLQIAGYRDGYFHTQPEQERVFKNIRALNPDIVICGMGTPLQEKFLIDLKTHGWNGIGYTCGGFLHQTAQKMQYYPGWIDRYNLRWIYRIYDEPRLFQRYFWEYPKFLFAFLYDYIQYRSLPEKPHHNAAEKSPLDN